MKSSRLVRAWAFRQWMIQSVKMHLEWTPNTRYRGRKCIYIISYSKSIVHFSKNLHDYIYFFYNSSIYKKLIKRLAFHHIACFCSISTTKIIPYTATIHSFVSLSNMVFCSWMNQLFIWFGFITMTHLLTVTWWHLLVVLFSYLKYQFFYNFKWVFNILCLIYQNIIPAFVTAG